MYKAVILYFSGTGNTWWAADKMGKLLDEKGIDAQEFSIDTLSGGGHTDTKRAEWLIKASDLVFLGWPVHGSDLPIPMKHFFGGLSRLNKPKHVHTFCTQMMFSGDGAWCCHKQLADKGLIIDTCAHFTMPSNMSISRGVLAPPKTDELAKQIMDECTVQIRKYIDDLLIGKAQITGRYSFLLGLAQRAPYRLMSRSQSKIMGVDESICTKCGQCADTCPAGNITMSSFPMFSDKCVLCLRCYSYCPAVAITARGKTRNTAKRGLPYRLRDSRFTPYLLKPASK